MKNNTLKFILSTIMLLSFIGCTTEPETKSTTVYVEPPPPPTPKTETVFYTYDGTDVKKYDGTEYTTILTGVCAYANNNIISENDILYTLDQYGDTISTRQLIETPDFIIISGADTWIIKNVAPADAYAAGALYKDYTKVYKNNVEYGQWFLRQWKTTDFFNTLSGNIFCRNSTGSFHLINGSLTDIEFAQKNSIVIFDYDAVNRTGKILTDSVHSISYSQNYFNNADYWQEIDGLWYSQNGYEWDAVNGLAENNNEMNTWREKINYIITIPFTEAATVITAGKRTENSETVLYWIECNTGSLMRYIPSIDRLEKTCNLYAGDGMRTTGILYKAALKPKLINDCLYFELNGQMYRYSFTEQNILLFFAGGIRIWK